MNLRETENLILSNRKDPSVIIPIIAQLQNRMKEIDYIMERFLDDFPESEDPTLIKFEIDHSNEYSKLSRLLKIANAYS